MAAGDRTHDGASIARATRELERSIEQDGSRGIAEAIVQLTAEIERIDRAADERLTALEQVVGGLGSSAPGDIFAATAPPRSVTLSADDFMTATEGFHDVERSDGGDAYRWTGASGGDFGFTMVVDRTRDLVARLMLWPRGPGMTPVPEALDCTVDGQYTRAWASSEEPGVYEVRVPANPGVTFTRLKFTTAVGDAGSEGDDRPLGVPFRQLTVEPDTEA